MNGEQALAKIRSTFQQKIAETPAVQKLIDKINSGKATYADTALYARWAAINLGMCLSGVICDIDLNDRAAVCKALMLDQYRDINGFVDIVQSELDSRFGIQLAPQRAPFNKERADTIGHSLADTTKPDEVIERRAENAVANAVESMHDDRMQAESKFRSRLGLTVVIERTGANCCPWCAEVAGKYRYGDEPDGVFRRHDNCNCTIIYDSQVLRGAVGEDGRRTKTWEEVNPEKVRGFEPDVNTPEQAKELEETALQGLTLPGVRDIIELSDEGELFERMRNYITGNSYLNTIRNFEKALPNVQNETTRVLLEQAHYSVSYSKSDRKRCYYNPDTNCIFLTNVSPVSTIAHELFHKIDNDNEISKSGILDDCIQYDYERLKQRIQTGQDWHQMLYSNYPEAFREDGKMKPEYRGISDIISGMTKGEVNLGYFHEKAYWKKPLKLQKETFAQYGRILFDGNSDVLHMISEIFPETTKEIHAIISKLRSIE